MIRREPGRLLHAALSVAASLLLLSGHLLVGTILWALAGLYVAYRVIAVARRRGFADRLASWVTVRLILVAGVAGPLIHRGVDVEWAAWVALGLAIVAIRTESVIGRAGRYQGMRTANIDGGPEHTPPRRALAALCIAEFAVLPLLLVFGLIGAPGWVWLLLLVPSGVFACLVVVRAVRQLSRTRDADAWVPEVMAELAPEFVLYWDAPKGTAYQVGMWVPYLKRIGRPFFIMVRNPNTFNQAVSVSDGVPVILCRTMADMDRCMTETLTTAFYVNNGAKNAHFVRYPQLTHVQLLHGDSDKASSFNPITVMFNKIYVAGQAGIDRYHNHGVDIPLEKFEIVGRPQVEDIAVGQQPLPEIEHPTVLYAPTWRGNYSDASYSSLPQAPALFEQLLARGCSIVFRPHPYCRKDPEFREIIKQLHQRLAEHTRETGREHVYGPAAETDMSVVDCFNASDAMISDVSSVIVDFLYSEKPFALIAVDRSAESFIDEFPLAVASYVLSGEVADWTGLLDQMFGQDPLAEQRKSLRVHYLGDFDRDNYADGFVAAAARQVAQRNRLAGAHEIRMEIEDPTESDDAVSVGSAAELNDDPDDSEG